MIEFKGSVSHKCERYIQKQEGKNGLFASIAVVILFVIPVICCMGVGAIFSPRSCGNCVRFVC